MAEQQPSQPKRGGGVAGALIPFVSALGLVGLGIAWFSTESQRQAQTVAAPEGCVMGGLDQVGGPLALVDINGRAVTQSDFAEGPTMLYFGFTHCPDVCPTTLYLMNDALNQLGPEGGAIQPALVSLDPDRDTTDVMDAYIGTNGFPEGLIGLTGTEDQVAAVARAFRVGYRKVPVAGSTDYTVDHTSFVYLLDENWRTQALYNTMGGTPDGLAQCARASLNLGGAAE